jgi:hypothetical protein
VSKLKPNGCLNRVGVFASEQNQVRPACPEQEVSNCKVSNVILTYYITLLRYLLTTILTLHYTLFTLLHYLLYNTDLTPTLRYLLACITLLTLHTLLTIHYLCCVTYLLLYYITNLYTTPLMFHLGHQKKKKTTAPRIPAWSPTVVLTGRHSG